jgi:hypothetical protein
MLMSQTPGSLYERFFEKVGEEAPSNVMLSLEEGSPQAARTNAIAAQYGIEIASPGEYPQIL